jgi:hypothetical protein
MRIIVPVHGTTEYRRYHCKPAVKTSMLAQWKRSYSVSTNLQDSRFGRTQCARRVIVHGRTIINGLLVISCYILRLELYNVRRDE